MRVDHSFRPGFWLLAALVAVTAGCGANGQTDCAAVARARAAGLTGDALSAVLCGDGGAANPDLTTVPCTPTTCAAHGKNCGTITDGCGGTIACGSCSGGETCAGGGTANVCGGGSS